MNTKQFIYIGIFLFAISSIFVINSPNSIFNDPYMPFSTMSNEDRLTAILEDDSNFNQGINDGKNAYFEGNVSLYDNAIEYCTYVAEREKFNSFNDPSFNYYIGVIRGYEKQEIETLKLL